MRRCWQPPFLQSWSLVMPVRLERSRSDRPWFESRLYAPLPRMAAKSPQAIGTPLAGLLKFRSHRRKYLARPALWLEPVARRVRLGAKNRETGIDRRSRRLQFVRYTRITSEPTEPTRYQAILRHRGWPTASRTTASPTSCFSTTTRSLA